MEGSKDHSPTEAANNLNDLEALGENYSGEELPAKSPGLWTPKFQPCGQKTS